MNRNILLFLIFLIAGSQEGLLAGIVDSSFYGFTVKDEIKINAVPDSVYFHIIHDISKWWDPEHTYTGNAGNLSLQSTPGGCFCETFPGGGFVRHMSVIYADAGKTIRLTGGLGPLQALAVMGTLTMVLVPEEKSTKAVFTYTVGGYSPDGLQKYAGIVDMVLSQQWRRLKSFIETLPGPSDSGRSGK
jgi:hypothetical protein